MDDIQEFIGSLAEGFYGRGEYTKMDRYRDFRRLFLGTEEGKRVLYELMGWGKLYGAIPANREQQDRDIFVMLGERNLVLQLLRTINLEPKMNPPKKAVSKKPKKR
jgi:hypothetical protein